MKNFIDLNEEENNEIKKINLNIKPVSKEDINYSLPKLVKIKTQNPILEEDIEFSLDKLVLSQQLDKEDICIIDGDASEFYGNREVNGSFKIENLFSELVNEYERAIARQNLGLGDSQTLNWGNIKGNILNQKDLKDYIFNSPQFIGMPTAPTQNINDSSSAIATTEWVVNYVNQNGGGGTGPSNLFGLKLFLVSPSYGIHGNTPIYVNISWEYDEEITSQKINGEILNINIREKTLTFNDSSEISLEYTINEKSYIKKVPFIIHYPYYYGTSSNYELIGQTISKSFNLLINENEYCYIILPIKDASLSVNGFVGGFDLINEQNLHGIKYYTYKSVNHSLGKLVVTLLN